MLNITASTKYRRVTDRRTESSHDGTPHDDIGRTHASHRAAKINRKSPKLYVEDKLSKNISPLREVDKRIRDKALPSCKFSRRSARDICLWTNNAYFPYRGLPCGGGLPSQSIHLYKALVELILSSKWHASLTLTVFEILAVKIWDFWALGVPLPKGETLCSRPIWTITQNSRRSVSPSPR